MHQITHSVIGWAAFGVPVQHAQPSHMHGYIPIRTHAYQALYPHVAARCNCSSTSQHRVPSIRLSESFCAAFVSHLQVMQRACKREGSHYWHARKNAEVQYQMHNSDLFIN
jgi:hypothetical protein